MRRLAVVCLMVAAPRTASAATDLQAELVAIWTGIELTATQAANAIGQAIIDYVASVPGGSVTCEEADGTPTVAGVSTIQFDQADGFTVTDEGGGQVQIDLSGVPDAVLATSYSGTGACGANTFASTLNDAAAPTCTQPSFANLTGQAGDAQIADGAVDGGTLGELADGTVTDADLATDSVGDDELKALAVEAELEAVMDLADLQGSVGIGQGGTTETASVEDAVLVGSGATDWQSKVIPNCPESGTLNYDNTSNTFSCLTDAGAGAATNTVAATVDFGATGDTESALLTVAASWVTGASVIVCSPTMLATADRTEGEEDGIAEGLTLGIVNRVAGVSFDLQAHAAEGDATGRFLVHCMGI